MTAKKMKIVFIYIFVMVLSGCGNNMTSNIPSGYAAVTSVPGVTFGMPTFILGQATAITSISNDNEYDTDSTYLYKDGESVYVLFNMESLVVYVKKGTSFDLDNAENEKEQVLAENLEGIWFNNVTNYSSNGGKYCFTLDSAQVNVTNSLYGDFTGMLAVERNGVSEWSIFAGIPGSKYDDLTKEQRSVIETIIKTFTLSDEAKEEMLKEVSPAETGAKSKEELADEKEVAPVGAENNSYPAVQDKAPEEEPSPTIKEEIPKEIPAADDVESAKEKEKTENNGHYDLTVETNQKKGRRTSEASYSDIYSMLSVGDKGFYQIAGENGTTEYIATIDKILTGKEASDMVKKYFQSEDAIGVYEDAPVGCSWNVAEYSVNADPVTQYTDIRLLGIDGEKLRFRGIEYPIRTYDIYTFMEEEQGVFSKLYCFYAVPNGCSEYMLEIGDKNPVDESSSVVACYHIKW